MLSLQNSLVNSTCNLLFTGQLKMFVTISSPAPKSGGFFYILLTKLLSISEN